MQRILQTVPAMKQTQREGRSATEQDRGSPTCLAPYVREGRGGGPGGGMEGRAGGDGARRRDGGVRGRAGGRAGGEGRGRDRGEGGGGHME